MKAYYEGRPEKEITEAYGSYRLKIRYFANCDSAQVSVYDIAAKLPLIWSDTMKDAQANAALEIFKAVGYFDYYATV